MRVIVHTVGRLFGDLKRATRRCRKGPYSKGKHSFEVLARLDSQKVMAAAPHAQRLIETLRRQSSVRT